MKYFLIFLVVVGFAVFTQQSFAWCLENSDWNGAPCYATAYQNFTREKIQDDWAPYYDYKGKEWMDQKKTELITAIRDGTHHEWREESDANSNVFDYYYAFYEMDKYAHSPLKQFKSGIPVDEIQCKDGLVQIFKKSDNSPACVTLNAKSKLIERGWAEPLGKIIKQRSGSMESSYIATCDPLIHKSSLPDIQIQNSTHSYDLQYCKWELHYPDLSLIPNNYLMNNYPYCADLYDALYEYYESINDDCGVQRYNEDGTPRAICEPVHLGRVVAYDINMVKSGCIFAHDKWAFLTEHNDDVFYSFDREINQKIPGNLDEHVKITEKLCDDKSLYSQPNIRFRNDTHWIDTDHCTLNINVYD